MRASERRPDATAAADRATDDLRCDFAASGPACLRRSPLERYISASARHTPGPGNECPVCFVTVRVIEQGARLVGVVCSSVARVNSCYPGNLRYVHDLPEKNKGVSPAWIQFSGSLMSFVGGKETARHGCQIDH